MAPADFEVLNTNWHPQSSFYVTSGTLSFKFLTQALSKNSAVSNEIKDFFIQQNSAFDIL